jgi:ketosteroid isomerase-like protein
MVSAGVQTIGQDWSAEQKEVWKMEIASWESFKAGDLERYMELWHKDAMAWPHWSEKPIGKEMIEVGSRPLAKFLGYDLKPLAINIFDKFAVVYYLVTSFRGDNVNRSRRIVHFWMKQDGNWRLIGGTSSGQV